MGMYVVAVGMSKGGTGKSTVAINLAAQAMRQGKRVLMINADYQRNTSQRLGAIDPPRADEPNLNYLLKEALKDGAGRAAEDTPKAILNTTWNDDDWLTEHGGRVDLLDTDPFLEDRSRDEYLYMQEDPENNDPSDPDSIAWLNSRLLWLLAPLDDYYDLAIVDAPPGTGSMLMRMIFRASHGIFTVVMLTRSSVEGLATWRASRAEMIQDWSPDLVPLGLIPNGMPASRQGVDGPPAFHQSEATEIARELWDVPDIRAEMLPGLPRATLVEKSESFGLPALHPALVVGRTSDQQMRVRFERRFGEYMAQLTRDAVARGIWAV